MGRILATEATAIEKYFFVINNYLRDMVVVRVDITIRDKETSKIPVRKGVDRLSAIRLFPTFLCGIRLHFPTEGAPPR